MLKRCCSLVVLLLVGLACGSVFAQDSFFKGKTVRIIVGASPGGGYDTYSRTIARHLGKHIPGNPAMLVENMPGAGFLISANYMYKAARPDGLTIGHFIGGLFMQQFLQARPGIEFESLKFEFVGAPGQDNYMCGLSKNVGITSAAQWFAAKTPFTLGGVGPGSGTDDLPKVLMAVTGLPARMVTGYKGTADVRLAFHAGEVQGVCNAWESFKATWRKELDGHEIIILLQMIAKRHPDLPNVPLAIEFAKTDEARKLIRAAVHTFGPTSRPYVVPPGTPKDRVEMLRKAFMETMKDPEFLAEAQKAKLDINPLDGAELEANVKEVFSLDPALVPKLREILK
jgi:tripartite-type tricarboxylate transporter receptor subunit TctC